MDMRAAVVTGFGGPDVIETQEWPAPEAGPGRVVVDVQVADVIFVETQIRQGLHGGFFDLKPPYVPGNSIGGQVRSVGDGVDGSWLGRTVLGRPVNWGGHAEQALVALDALVAVPGGLDLETAVAVYGDGFTALLVYGSAPVKAGNQVLITAAAGGLGVLLVQLAQAAGAHVIGATRSRAKLDLVKAQGADVVVDYSEPGWEKLVLEATGGRGTDVVFEGAGGQLGKAAFETLKDGGWISAHGAPSGGFAEIDPAVAESKGITVKGINDLRVDPASAPVTGAQVLAEAVTGRLVPVIDRTFTLDQLGEAHAAIENRSLLGKALIVI
jgi:NADPH2:quinone reductase